MPSWLSITLRGSMHIHVISMSWWLPLHMDERLHLVLVLEPLHVLHRPLPFLVRRRRRRRRSQYLLPVGSWSGPGSGYPRASTAAHPAEGIPGLGGVFVLGALGTAGAAPDRWSVGVRSSSSSSGALGAGERAVGKGLPLPDMLSQLLHQRDIVAVVGPGREFEVEGLGPDLLGKLPGLVLLVVLLLLLLPLLLPLLLLLLVPLLPQALLVLLLMKLLQPLQRGQDRGRDLKRGREPRHGAGGREPGQGAGGRRHLGMYRLWMRYSVLDRGCNRLRLQHHRRRHSRLRGLHTPLSISLPGLKGRTQIVRLVGAGGRCAGNRDVVEQIVQIVVGHLSDDDLMSVTGHVSLVR